MQCLNYEVSDAFSPPYLLQRADHGSCCGVISQLSSPHLDEQSGLEGV